MPIGFYARKAASLPNPPYPMATLRVIERGIAEAWRIIRDHPEGDFQLASANEDRITLELRNCLMNNVLHSAAVPGFSHTLFRITREAKFESFDGSHLDKMPDLHIDVIRDAVAELPSADGLFVECKPVGAQHPAGGEYCDKGISRFVSGQYAWGMTQGMMVGYASLGYEMPRKLQGALRTRRKALRYKGELRACPDGSPAGYLQHVHTSVHRRSFTYLVGGCKAPEIELRHVWLNRN